MRSARGTHPQLRAPAHGDSAGRAGSAAGAPLWLCLSPLLPPLGRGTTTESLAAPSWPPQAKNRVLEEDSPSSAPGRRTETRRRQQRPKPSSALLKDGNREREEAAARGKRGGGWERGGLGRSLGRPRDLRRSDLGTQARFLFPKQYAQGRDRAGSECRSPERALTPLNTMRPTSSG